MNLDIKAKISLEIAKFKANAATTGSIYKSMTVDAQKNAANVDKLIAKNLSNRVNASNQGKIHDMRNLTEFEKHMINSSKRMDKEARRASEARITNMGGVKLTQKDLAQPTPIGPQRPMGPLISNQKRDELAYTKWWQGELARREQIAWWESNKTQKKLTANERKVWAGLLQERRKADRTAAWNGLKESIAANATKAKYDVIYTAGVIRRNIEMSKAERKAAEERHQGWMRASVASGEFDKSMARTRYALYDIGQKAIAMGMAIVGAFAYAINEAAKFESAFTSVERTVGLTRDAMGNLDDQGKQLKNTLLALATTTPVSFEDITRVATLGAQMGIAADSIDNFTKTVIQFSAITGVSVDEASQSFGRLGQLLDVPSSKFENLSSAITYVGVNAVATDREILVMSESISAAANQAGFAADEVIGLSGALASLKVRPEEARGVIVRLFRTIDRSVSEGGKQLDDFAKTMSLSSEEAKNLWKQDPSKFFSSFLQGAKNAGDLNNTISALGITNSREVNVIQRLANNTDVLASTMKDAHEQYLLGTYAGDAYKKVQDDLASKMIILQNVIQQIAAAFGETLMPAIKPVLDVLIFLGNVFSHFPGWAKGLIAIIAAAVGGMLLFKGAMFLSVAGLLAVRTAMKGLGDSSIKSMASLGTVKFLMQDMGLQSGKAAAGLAVMSGGLIKVGAAGEVAAFGLTQTQKAMGVIGLVTTLAMVLWAVAEASMATGSAATKLGDAMIEAGGGTDELRKAMLADTAVYEKTGEALGKLTFKYDENVVASSEKRNADLATAEAANATVEGIRKSEISHGKLTDATEINKDAQEKFNETIANSNDLLGQQELALGSNTAAFVANALAKYGENQDQNLYKDLAGDKEKAFLKDAERLGFNIADMISAGMAKQGGAEEYVKKFENALMQLSMSQTLVIEADWQKELQEQGKILGLTAEETKALGESIRKTNIETKKAPDTIHSAAKATDEFRVSAQAAAAATELQKETLIDQGYSAEAAADMVEGLTDQLKKYLGTATGAVDAQSTLIGSFHDLSKGLSESSNNMDIFTEDGRQNLANWKSYMTAALDAAAQAGEGFMGGVEKIAGGLTILQEKGVDTSTAFSEMRDYISTAVGAESVQGASDLAAKLKETTDPTQMRAVINAWIAQNSQIEKGKDKLTDAQIAAANYGRSLLTALAGGTTASRFLSQWVAQNTKVIKNNAREVKTLSDYAKDLGNVFKEALRFRFQKQNAFAELRSTLDDINDKIKDAKSNILDLQKSLSENTKKRADLAIDYQLALQFGDIQGAADIANEMAQLDAQISEDQKQMAYNIDLTTGSLDLNTQAGRDNDKALQDLIGSNADYIQTLVDSGASQATINKAIEDGEASFRAQAKAMGIADTEIDRYAKSFTDFKTIVKNTPKNVTVAANTDPAKRALNEFIAQVNASKATMTVEIKEPTKEERKAALVKEQKRLEGLRDGSKNNLSAWEYYNTRVIGVKKLIESGNYAQGGLLTGPGSSQSDSMLIRASRDEYIVQASAVNRYGAGFFNALNQQQIPPSAMFGGSGGSQGGVVYLSSMDRALLQAAIDRPITLRTTNRTIAEAANDGNRELARRGKA